VRIQLEPIGFAEVLQNGGPRYGCPKNGSSWIIICIILVDALINMKTWTDWDYWDLYIGWLFKSRCRCGFYQSARWTRPPCNENRKGL